MMRRSSLLVAFMLLGSAVWWWPCFALAVSPWLPFGSAALCMSLSIVLAPSMWPLLVFASATGTFGGFVLSATRWPSGDPIGAPFVVPVAAGIASVLVVVGGFARLLVPTDFVAPAVWRRAVLAAILGWVALGVVSLAFSPVLIRQTSARTSPATQAACGAGRVTVSVPAS